MNLLPGSHPPSWETVFERIREINQTGVSILLVEQNAREALRMSDRGYILVGPARTASRTPAHICSTTQKLPPSTLGDNPLGKTRLEDNPPLPSYPQDIIRRLLLAWSPGHTAIAIVFLAVAIGFLPFVKMGLVVNGVFLGGHHRLGSRRINADIRHPQFRQHRPTAIT